MSAQIQSPKKLEPRLLLCNSCHWAATVTAGWKPDRCPACGAVKVARLAIRGMKAHT